MTSRLPIRLCLVVFFLLSFRLCFADGIFIPTAVRQFPGIPLQRALVKYVDGVQTLVVESTLEGEDDRYGWILPVPNVPHRLEKISPGLLQTLSLQLAPEIEVLTPGQGISKFLLYTLVVIICISFIRFGMRGGLVGILVGVVVLFMIVPNFIQYRSGLPDTAGVKLVSKQTVGEYETFVIEAETSDDLNDWLADNDFLTFPDEALPVIDDYIAEQWVFFAARLSEAGAIRFAPHPILLEFTTDTPVYPMRLTALQDTPVDLELFLLSRKQMVPVNYDLRKEYCNTFFLQDTPSGARNDKLAGSKRFVSGYEVGNGRYRRNRRQQVGHPDAFEVFWNGCVMTKYIGNIPVDRMNEDMLFTFEKPVAFRHHIRVAENKADAIMSTIVLPIFFFIGLPILTISYRITQAHARLRKIKLPVLAALSILLVAACVIASALSDIQQVGTAETHGDTPAAEYEMIGHPRDEWEMFKNGIYEFFESYDRLDGKIVSDEELEESLIDGHSEQFHNPFTGAAVIIEDSPGNVMPVRENGVLTGVNLYFRDGSPRYLQLVNYLGNRNFDSLFKDLKDWSPAIRKRAVLELERRGNPVAIGPLEALFDDRDRQVRHLAYIAVARISKDPDRVEHLVEMLADEDHKIRISAADALEEITGRDFGEDPYQWRSWFEQSTKTSSTEENNPPILQPNQDDSTWQSPADAGQSEVQLLIGKLKHPDFLVRQEAVDSLAEIENPDELQPAVQPLLEALDIGNLPVTVRPGLKKVSLNYRKDPLREKYIEILGNAKDPRAVEPLLVLLTQEDSDIQKAAAKALGKIGDDRAVEGLITALSDPDWVVRKAAATALGRLGSDRAVEGLITALSNDSARSFAAHALAQTRHPDGIDALLSCLRGDTPGQGYIIKLLLEKNEPRVIKPMIEMLVDPDPKFRGHVFWSLSQMTGEDAFVVEALLDLLADENHRNRLTAISALEKLKDDRAVKGLIAALSDEHQSVRQRSAHALGEIGHPDGIDALLSCLHSGYPDRIYVTSVLVRINEPRVIDPMIDMLREPNLLSKSQVSKRLYQMTGENFGEDADQWQQWWDNNRVVF